MPQLILVKHSLPEIIPDLPAKRWQLSEEGRRRCVPLAQRLAAYDLQDLVASVEPKARETAEIVAAHLGLPWRTAPGLHEHERAGYTSTERFEASIAALFEHPGERVYGTESAEEARERFVLAVESAIEAHAGRNLAIVTHGTVITLFVAAYNSIEPFAFWKRLDLPAYVVLQVPGFRIVETVASVRGEHGS